MGLLKGNSINDAEKEQMLKLIQNCVFYSDSIIRDLLDYSKERLDEQKEEKEYGQQKVNQYVKSRFKELQGDSPETS